MSFLNYRDCLHVNTIYSFWIQIFLWTKVFLWVLWQYLHECHSLHIQLGVLRRLSYATMTFKPSKGRRNSGELITDLLIVDGEVWWLLWLNWLIVNFGIKSRFTCLWNNTNYKLYTLTKASRSNLVIYLNQFLKCEWWFWNWTPKNKYVWKRLEYVLKSANYCRFTSQHTSGEPSDH